MGDYLSISGNTATLRIRLTPKAAKNGIGGTFTDEKGNVWLKASVTAVPEKGRANEALIELLSKTFKIRKTAITLASGETDRHKIFKISDIDEAATVRMRAPASAS
ncbi:MAG: DUF167 domain-containing protein [Alphaproteobacteria bacterium]|nr:DUF167 domain-containing protein [Alphaproteobacteria bacterium]